MYDNAFKVEWELFLRHVVDGGPFRWNLLEGAKGVQLAELGLQSWRERRFVDVPRAVGLDACPMTTIKLPQADGTLAASLRAPLSRGPHRPARIMNGVTGRMGTNQHLVRSILAIRKAGRRRARRRTPDHARSDPGRPQRGQARGARASARRRALDHRPRRRARRQERRDLLRCASTGRRPALIRKAIAAGKHIYTEKPIAPTRRRALDLYRRAEAAGVKHGVVQDKLWLPGLLKLKMLIDAGFFGRILSVRGEFGYWVFEGDWQPAQRPSWNYRKEDDGGIIVDMLCHWRYVLDNLFGAVKSVICLGATHIPKRWDENGKPYAATADDAAYATFELARTAIIAQINSSWCTRVRRDDLVTFQVDGTLGSAVAGLTECRIQPRTATPKPVWNPGRAADDRLLRHLAARSGESHVRQRVQGRVGAFPAPRRRRRPFPLESARRRERRAARRARPAELARAALRRCAGAVGLTPLLR